MYTQDVKRKLTAILSADVEGYSRLMGKDDVGTIRTLTAYRDTMTNLILLHRGRVVDAPGDNLLAEFVSVVDAVQCAVDIQRELAELNQELPADKRMLFRIGVNLGDVVEEKDRIYGDGVNIAARLESLCHGGGVCISGAAFENVENKLDLEFEDLGNHEVKNIAKPVRVYRVLSYPGAAAQRVIQAKRTVEKKWRRIAFAIPGVLLIVVAAGILWNFNLRPAGPQIEVASVEKMALPLPDKPSIAVLPFVNMSDDPDQEYFSDGITEDIITDLSKITGLLVISRSSTFAYKGKPIKIKQVAEEFGVRYVLEGSVRKSNDKIRINAQLIDAITGQHLWAERYDGDLKDIFALQDELTQKIVMTLRVELNEAELERIKHIPTENLTAYESAMRGVGYLRGRKKPTNARARLMFERAIELDSDYAGAYVGLCWTYLAEWLYGWTDDPQAPQRAFELVQKAIRLDDSHASAYRMLAMIYLWKDRQHEQAIAGAEKAIALDPNNAFGYSTLAETLKFAGQPEEVIALMKTAMRLNPRYPGSYLFQTGSSYYYMGRYDEALAYLKRAVTQMPNHLPTRAYLAAIYTEFGQKTAAQAEVAEMLRITPNYSLENDERYPYKDPAYRERIRNHLRRAGVPEKPPPLLPDKPSIAVLPFDNMSDDPQQEYFSDGITEELITALSKLPKLFVIARNSTFTYKGKPVNIQQVGRELGVKYVLEGSVRKDENRVRITAQLIDAATGHHLWAERYDRELTDIFALQDEITLEIITAMQVKLTEGEQGSLAAKGTDNLEAYLKVLQGREHIIRSTREENILAKQAFETAVRLDPKYAAAYAGLSRTHLLEWVTHWSHEPRSLERALELAQKAISLDGTFSGAYEILGWTYLWKKQHAKAIAALNKTISLNPNDADGYAALGGIMNFAGQPAEAIGLVEKAMRLNPHYSDWYLIYIGHSYFLTEQHAKAIEEYKRALARNPNFLPPHIELAAIYSILGREAEARAEAQEVLRLSPDFTLEGRRQRFPYKDAAVLERNIEALRRAGLK